MGANSMSIDNKELFAERVTAGAKMYFFDVKENDRGQCYLVINEAKKIGDKWERSRVIVSENNIFAFNDHLKKAIQFLMDRIIAQPKKMLN
jgi:hypothetical protein